MSVKLGDIYYEVMTDTETTKIEIWEWHVKTIRGKFFYCVAYLRNITYGKRSKKAGDFGWLHPIPAWARRRFLREPTEFSATPEKCRMFRSKIEALESELVTINLFTFDYGDDRVASENFDKATRTLKSMITKESKK